MVQYPDLFAWASVFIVGIAVGAVSTSAIRRLWGPKERSAQLAAARLRILTGLKEQREKEALRDICQAAEALNAEIQKSLGRLLTAVNRLVQVYDQKRHREGARPGRPLNKTEISKGRAFDRFQ